MTEILGLTFILLLIFICFHDIEVFRPFRFSVDCIFFTVHFGKKLQFNLSYSTFEFHLNILKGSWHKGFVCFSIKCEPSIIFHFWNIINILMIWTNISFTGWTGLARIIIRKNNWRLRTMETFTFHAIRAGDIAGVLAK